ncbi:MAG TPA: threonine/serine dehydratase [Hyphomicrobiaceae bacterium]|nr:threonine/serine dehydratase [Hyphomicrobiaceae bacterium]
MTDQVVAVNRAEIARCETLLRPHVRQTPTIEIDGSDLAAGACKLCLKLELLQHSGSFKARGAFANLLARKVPAAGVVAASGGNHGAAVAYAAMRLQVPAKIFVPSVSSPAKVQRIREYGADLVIHGDLYADALAASEAWMQRSGAMSVHAFDQSETMLGQGTVGIELSRQAPNLDTLLVAVGGGGLIAGIAAWYSGSIKVVGVEPVAAPTLTKAFEAGHPVDAPAGGVAADSLAPRRVGELVFPIARKYVHETVLVTDAAIGQAQLALWRSLRVVAEPGGAAALSALTSGAYKARCGERVGVIVSGGNTTAVNLDR